MIPLRWLKIFMGCFCGWLVLFCGCAQTRDGIKTGAGTQAAVSEKGSALQTPAEQYAGEVLAYMMPVTLGKTGEPKLRQEWGDRGLDFPLDYGAISAMMLGPEKDPRRVMVLDNNILGLSQVLYHYDKNLNLFKGRNSQESVYPSTELVSIRIMLLQKMNREEKVGLAELMNRKAQLLDPRVPADEIRLEGTNLKLSEMKLLKNVIQAEPSFFAYLEHPFIVSMLYRIGAVEMDDYVQDKIRSARYTEAMLADGRKRPDNKSVQVAVLPSIIDAFAYQAVDTDAYPGGFMPREAYSGAVERFRDTLVGFLQKLVTAQMFGDAIANDTEEEKRRDASVKSFIEAHLDIRSLDRRPLVVYPENAAEVIQDVCHDADFNVIVLGKNVYLSMHILDVDTFPHVNRLYLDVSDILYGQAEFEISQISMFVFNKLKPLIPPSE